MVLYALCVVFTYSRFIKNTPIRSWERNTSFLRWFYHTNHRSSPELSPLTGMPSPPLRTAARSSLGHTVIVKTTWWDPPPPMLPGVLPNLQGCSRRLPLHTSLARPPTTVVPPHEAVRGGPTVAMHDTMCRHALSPLSHLGCDEAPAASSWGRGLGQLSSQNCSSVYHFSEIIFQFKFHEIG
jgi:hypothetical protein